MAVCTRSDTEVLLVSYIQWGPACLERLNGIFAFGIWNEAERTLFLARDRLGVKPLFYADLDDCFIFGSEPKALLVHPRVSTAVDAEGLAEIFALGPARTPGHAVYRDLGEVKPGHFVTVTPQGVSHRQYWRLESRPHTDDLDTTVERVKELLPMPSAGSSSPTCPSAPSFRAASTPAPSPPTPPTPSPRQEKDRFTLTPWTIRATPNTLNPTPFSLTPTAVTSKSSPTTSAPSTTKCSSTAVNSPRPRCRGAGPGSSGMADIDASLYLFCSEIKKDATVALSGECADEIFGGYPWFHREEFLSADTFPWSRSTHLRASWLSPWLRELIRPEEYVAQRYRESLDEVPHLPGESPRERRMREISYLNLTWFMVTLLNRKDRMSMATGLEVRVPFADHRLVEYLWNVPWEMKACDGREKGLLRRALRGVLPDEVLYRRKSPYPKSHQPEYAEAVRRRLLEILDDPASPLCP